jgi:hypothetical protein
MNCYYFYETSLVVGATSAGGCEIAACMFSDRVTAIDCDAAAPACPCCASPFAAICFGSCSCSHHAAATGVEISCDDCGYDSDCDCCGVAQLDGASVCPLGPATAERPAVAAEPPSRGTGATRVRALPMG